MNDWVYGAGFADVGHIVPLDEFIESDPTFAETHDFVPGYFNAMQRHGKQYGLPIYGESTFLMYRKDLFEEYGIPVPTTMDELMDAARQVYEKSGGKTYGITLRGRQGIHNVYVWAAFLWAFGGRWFDENGRPARTARRRLPRPSSTRRSCGATARRALRPTAGRRTASNSRADTRL